MKMLMIFVDANHADDVAALLDRHDVAGYSRFPDVLGKGVTGTKLGTRAFPGSSALFLAVLAAPMAEVLAHDLRELGASHGPEEGLKAYALDAKEIL